MTAELCRVKCLLGLATLLFLLLLSLIVYCTVTGVFVADVLERDRAFKEKQNLSSETYGYYDGNVDQSTQSSAIWSEEAPGVVENVSTADFCKVIWKNKHLLRGVPELRATVNVCGWGRHTESETEGDAAGEATGMDGQDYSDQTSNANELAEWCRQQDQIDDDDVRQILIHVCRDINETDTTTLADSFGEVTTEHVTTQSDATTVAPVEEGTAATDVVHTMDTSDIWKVICQNVHLVSGYMFTKVVLSSVCDTGAYEGERTMNVTGWTPSESEEPGLVAQESGLSKLRWVCAHPDQAENLPYLSIALPTFCEIIDEIGPTSQSSEYNSSLTSHLLEKKK